jgi:hypothetical protein
LDLVAEFLVEAYHPTTTGSSDEPAPHDVAEAAAKLSHLGDEVALVRAIVVPDDETCFYLFEATRVGAVLETVGLSGIRVLRTLLAQSAWVRPESDLREARGSSRSTDAKDPQVGGAPA